MTERQLLELTTRIRTLEDENAALTDLLRRHVLHIEELERMLGLRRAA